jgi:hypothetical protein
MTTIAAEPARKTMSVLHALVVGAAVLGFLFVLCWAGDAVGIDAYVPTTHRFVSIFTASPETSSPAALIGGLPWAAAFGAVAGAAVAIFGNAFQFLGRR